jgi:hypothetical protein
MKQQQANKQAAKQSQSADLPAPFTPVVFERYEFIGGERGVRLGYPTKTESGQTGMCWTHRATGAAA